MKHRRHFHVFYQDKKLFVQGAIAELMVINLNGDRVLYIQNNPPGNYIGCAFLPAGVYFYRAVNADKKAVMGKLFVVE